MTDRELLELAAKAAGITLEWDGHPDQWQPMFYKGKTYYSFDPLEDDGAALWLAVKIKWIPSRVDFERLALSADPYVATRRAIVRAAAEIGRNMK